MKKYFMKASGEEVQFGDMIAVDLTKDAKDGSIVHHHIECKFAPELVELLLDEDIIDEENVDEEEENDEGFIPVCELVEAIQKQTEEIRELKACLLKFMDTLNPKKAKKNDK